MLQKEPEKMTGAYTAGRICGNHRRGARKKTMEWQLENERLLVRVSSRGAELLSLYDKIQGRDYLWQGAEEVWNRHSMLLFPTAGRISRSRILVEGREYPLAMHGFLKDMEFFCGESKPGMLKFSVTDTQQTRRSFPFPFLVSVTFVLGKKELTERIRITNTGEKEMSFGFGAHPGFFCPIVLGESADDYVLAFDRPQKLMRLLLEPETRLCTGKRETWLQNNDCIRLRENFFDEGPVLTEGCNADWIELRSIRSGTALRMGIKDFPYLTLWGSVGQLGLICVEPWCGTSDFAGTNHCWEEKEGNEHLQPDQTFERNLTFSIM